MKLPPASTISNRASGQGLKSTFAAILLGCIASSNTLAWSNKFSSAADVFFQNQSVSVNTAGQKSLQNMVDKADQHLLEAVIAVGHADPVELNLQDLSKRRADAVVFQLIQLGVSPTRIYAEGKGASQPLEDENKTRQRRVEVESVGRLVPSPSQSTYGFSLMFQWHQDAQDQRKRQSADQGYPWDAMTPLHFLPLITDATMRTRFLQKYRMVAVRSRQDELLKSLQRLDSPMALSADMESALLAAVFGTPFAKTVFAPALERLNVSDAGVHDFAQQLWCDAQAKPLMNSETLTRMRLPQVAMTLSPQEQEEWISCSARKADLTELHLLQSWGVNINATNPEGRGALHDAIRYYDPSAINVLLKAGANPNAQDAQGQTPAHEVRSAGNRYPMMPGPSESQRAEVLKALIAAGADLSLRNHKGATANTARP